MSDRLWNIRVSKTFLESYIEEVNILLNIYLLEKALCELLQAPEAA